MSGYERDISAGIYPNREVIHKFGSTVALPQTPLTPITSAQVYRTPTTLTSLEVVSSSVNDTSAGTGARTVQVEGIGTGWEVVTEDITMNGTTAVALTAQFYRVYRMKVLTSGTYASETAGSHDGTLTLRETGAGQTWATVTIENGLGNGQTSIGVITTPIDTKAYIVQKTLHVESGKPASFYLYIREEANTVAAPYKAMRVLEAERSVGAVHKEEFFYPRGPFIGPCDLGFMGISTSASLSDASVEFTLVIER
jgi:hypothetical protein